MVDNSLAQGKAQGAAANPPKVKSKFREYSEAFLTAILVALFLRGFVVEAFKIPSKSMVPTLMVGDHIFVNKFAYGIRLPFSKHWLTQFKEPKRGDVVVFKYPLDESTDFIKRVVGLPGDKLKFQDGDVIVNGQKLEEVPLKISGRDPSNKRELLLAPNPPFPEGDKFTKVPYSPEWEEFDYYLERLGDHTHIKQENGSFLREGEEITVPPNHFFAMGDNRGNSSDSRVWGPVPMENLKGRAMLIWLSWDHDQGGVRYDRFGKWIE